MRVPIFAQLSESKIVKTPKSLKRGIHRSFNNEDKPRNWYTTVLPLGHLKHFKTPFVTKLLTEEPPHCHLRQQRWLQTSDKRLLYTTSAC